MRIPKTIRELVLIEIQNDPVLPWDPYAAHQFVPRNQNPQAPIPNPETYAQRASRKNVSFTPTTSKTWTGVQPQTTIQDPSITQKTWQALNKPYYIDDLAKSFLSSLKTAPQQAWKMLKQLNASLTPEEFAQLKAVIKKHNI